ncbi:MAG: hypothetical protein ACPHGV_04940, partial [Synechococcus sp.]
MGSKSGFKDSEVQEIKRLYLDEGRSFAQIARIVGKGSETSVRNALMKACRCDRSYESLEQMVKDRKIEAIFVATDAPSHARHCIDV